MGYSKLSVTIPDETYKELKELAAKEKRKVSRLVADAIAEKTKRMKEEALIRQINRIFDDSDVSGEQSLIAEIISNSADVEELPW